MSLMINASRLVLLLLCAAGYYGTWHILLNNGTTEYMAHIRDVGPRLLPGTNEPLKTKYIGIPAIDFQLTVLDLFFWEIVDGSHPAASLFCFHFATQVACGWSLLMLEGLRRGHRWMVISFIGTLGILVQNAAYAVVVPLYLVLYLSTSPLISPQQVSDYSIDIADIAAIPTSICLGYVLPALLMSLPAPSIIGFEPKQIFMAIWQMFPLWVTIIQTILPYLMATFVDIRTTPYSQHGIELYALRQLYLMLIIVAGIGQVSTLTLIATSQLFPALFAPQFIGVFNFSNVFVPRAISSSTKMPSIGAGSFLLLQYDELIGSTSMALFATTMYVSAYRRIISHSNLASLVLSVMCGVSALILTGPLGYAVACIWARDEMIAAEDEEGSKKTN